MKSTNISVGGINYEYAAYSRVPDTIKKRHCHDTYEILFLEEGEGIYIVEGCEYKIFPGAIMFTKPFEYHCISINENSPYERSLVKFADASVDEDIKRLLEVICGTEDSGCFYPPQEVSETVRGVFARFRLAEKMSEDEKAIYMKLLTSELVVLLSSGNGERFVSNEEDIGIKLLRYINDHLDKDITLDSLSRKFFASKYYLCRAFKRKNGVSIHNYVTHKRVMHAKQLMDFGESAASAAYKVGFGDYSAFYRAYVKIIGASPSEKAGGRRDD